MAFASTDERNFPCRNVFLADYSLTKFNLTKLVSLTICFYLTQFNLTKCFLSFRFHPPKARHLKLIYTNTKAYSAELFKLVYQSSIVYPVNWYFNVVNTLADNKAIRCSLKSSYISLNSRHLGFERQWIPRGREAFQGTVLGEGGEGIGEGMFIVLKPSFFLHFANVQTAHGYRIKCHRANIRKWKI